MPLLFWNQIKFIVLNTWALYNNLLSDKLLYYVSDSQSLLRGTQVVRVSGPRITIQNTTLCFADHLIILSGPRIEKVWEPLHYMLLLCPLIFFTSTSRAIVPMTQHIFFAWRIQCSICCIVLTSHQLSWSNIYIKKYISVFF